MVRGASLHCNHRILVHRKLSFEEYLPARLLAIQAHGALATAHRATAWPPLITMHDFSAALISTAASRPVSVLRAPCRADSACPARRLCGLIGPDKAHHQPKHREGAGSHQRLRDWQ